MLATKSNERRRLFEDCAKAAILIVSFGWTNLFWQHNIFSFALLALYEIMTLTTLLHCSSEIWLN